MVSRGEGAVVAAVFLALASSCEGPQLKPANADLAFSEDSLDWGLVALGEEVPKAFSVRNAGVAPTTLTAFSVSPPFSVRGFPAEGVALASGDEIGFQVVFSPTAEGPVAAHAVVEGDDGSGPLLVALKGEGAKPVLQLSPGNLDFGQVPLGSSRAMPLQVTNAGKLDLQVSFTVEGPDAAEYPAPAALQLPPGASKSISPAFSPNHVGVGEATMKVHPCATCPEMAVPLTGEAVASCIQVSPASIDFGSVKVGEISLREVTLRNPGRTALDVVDVFPSTASSPDFSVSGFSPGAAIHLEPGASYTLTVGLTPSSNGPRQAAVRMRATGVGADGCWAEVRLQGNGGEGCLLLSPDSVDFGVVALGMTGQRRVQIANLACGADVRIDEVQVVGDAAFTAGAARQPPFALAQGDAVDVIVRYSPTVNGTAAGSLHVVGSDPVTGAPLTEPPPDVMVTGTARTLAPCEFTASPPRLDFGAVNVGRAATLGFRVANTGQDSCYFTNLKLSSNTAQAFTMDGDSPGFVLATGEQRDALVRFMPPSAGAYSGAIESYVSDPNDPYRTWAVTGSGTTGCLSIDPNDIDFGTVYSACPPPSVEVTLSNRCPGDTVLQSLVRGAGTSLEFMLPGAPAFPYTLRAGGTLRFLVQYAPVDDGLDSMPLYLDDGRDRHLVSVRGRGVKDPWRTDSYDQASRQQVDVLFVLDNSGSMSDKQAAIASNLSSFLLKARNENVDYHLAVTTTGLEPSDGGWTDCPGGVSGGEAGRLFPADNSGPRLLTPRTPDAAAVWDAMTHVGTCHWLEQGLEASLRALTTPLVDHADDARTLLPDDGNLGFYRPQAKLVVIYVSDEDDQSDSSVASYLAFFKALKPDPVMLSVSAVVTPLDMSTCSAGTSSGERYIELRPEPGRRRRIHLHAGLVGEPGAAGRQRLRPQHRLPAHRHPRRPVEDRGEDRRGRGRRVELRLAEERRALHAAEPAARRGARRGPLSGRLRLTAILARRASRDRSTHRRDLHRGDVRPAPPARLPASGGGAVPRPAQALRLPRGLGRAAPPPARA
ncbi:MAG: choice-of-anchor D domain-containing protein [Myxococcales bacterium]